jgi:integrase
MATAKKLPSGSWRVQVYTGRDAAGRRQYLSFTRSTKKEAEYDALQYQLHYREVSRDITAMTLREAAERYIRSKDGVLSPSTIRGYDIILRNHLKRLMDIRLNRLTQAMVQEAINEEARPRQGQDGGVHTPSPKSVRNIYGFLSAVLREYHPGLVLRITLPQRQHREQAALEPEQISQLIAAVRGGEMELPVLLSLWLSLRSSEVTGLTWGCVDFERSTITVRQAKVRNKENQWIDKTTKTTQSTRVIRAPAYIMELLQAAKGDAALTDYVVPIRGNCLYQRFKTILRRNNLPDIRFHDLRHTFASVCLLLNIPDKYVMQRGGWSNPSTLKSIYQHALTSKRQSTDDQIDAYFYQLIG